MNSLAIFLLVTIVSSGVVLGDELPQKTLDEIRAQSEKVENKIASNSSITVDDVLTKSKIATGKVLAQPICDFRDTEEFDDILHTMFCILRSKVPNGRPTLQLMIDNDKFSANKLYPPKPYGFYISIVITPSMAFERLLHEFQKISLYKL